MNLSKSKVEESTRHKWVKLAHILNYHGENSEAISGVHKTISHDFILRMSRFNRLYSVSISEYCKCEGERWIVDGIPYVRSRKFYHRSLYILHAALTQAKNLKLWCIIVSFLLLCYIKYQTSALVLIIDVTLTSICNMYPIPHPPHPHDIQ